MCRQSTPAPLLCSWDGNAVFSVIDGQAFEIASAGQCGFIGRNELLLVNYVGKFGGLKPDAPSIAVFSAWRYWCPSGRPTSGIESNFRASDNPNVAVRMPDKSIYLAGQGCLVHRTRPPRRDVGILPMPG